MDPHVADNHVFAATLTGLSKEEAEDAVEKIGILFATHRKRITEQALRGKNEFRPVTSVYSMKEPGRETHAVSALFINGTFIREWGETRAAKRGFSARTRMP